ncbi:hypothetical protein ACH5RR_037887 [Cinchona calisaya]|uniref:Pentatricopeptide repeat-containing protein n=1 Tax=Cinchona calisaya TaxID=153742 RepID=A0ABD2Y8T0_9GENT
MKRSGVHITKNDIMALIGAYAACGQFGKAKQVVSYCVRHEHLATAVDLLKQLKHKVNIDNVAAQNIFDRVFCKISEKEPTNMHFGLAMLQQNLVFAPQRKALIFCSYRLTACASAKDLEACFLSRKEYKAAGLEYNVLSFGRIYQALLALGDRKSAPKYSD